MISPLLAFVGHKTSRKPVSPFLFQRACGHIFELLMNNNKIDMTVV